MISELIFQYTASLIFVSYINLGFFWYTFYPNLLGNKINVYISLGLCSFVIIGWFSLFRNRGIIYYVAAYALYMIMFIIFLAVTAEYSPSDVIRSQKLLLIFVNIPACFFIGFVVFYGNLTEYFYASAIVSLIGFFSLGDTLVSIGDNNEGIISYQTINDSYSVSGILAFAYILSEKFKRAGGVIRLFFVGYISVIFLGIVSSGGRGGLLQFSAGSMAVYLGHSRDKNFPLGYMLFLTIAIAVIFMFFDDFVDLFFSMADSLNMSTVKRIFEYAEIDETIKEGSRDHLREAAWLVWQAHPIFGAGLGGFALEAGFGEKDGAYPHNLFLDLLAEQGVVGLVAYILCVLRYYRMAYFSRSVATKFEKLSLLGLGVGSFFLLNFSNQLVADHVTWFVVGGCVAIHVREWDQDYQARSLG